MPSFQYAAINKEGKPINGTTDAANREAVSDALMKQGLRPVSIKQASNSDFNIMDRLTGGKKVKLKDLVIFSRQMSTMVSAGVPLTKALATMQGQTTNKYFQSVIAGISKDVEGGMALGDAFAKYPNVFSEIYINMIKAGEAGGILDEILKRLASQVEKDASMRKKIKSAMTYPSVIMGITVIAFFGITTLVLPKIGKMLIDLGGEDAKLPVYTQAMLTVSAFMTGKTIIKGVPNLLFIIIAGFITITFLRRYIKTPKGKYKFHALLLRIPILKDLIMKIAIARFARTFASLMSSGVTVLDALEVTGGAIGNKVIEAELAEAAKDVRNGKQLSDPISRSKHFPAIVSQMLAIGEETGQTDTILIKVADFYEEEVETIIDGLSSIIEPIMIIVLGAGVGLIAASVMGPIASLSQNMGG